jgi:predicted lysophospholipase L1 biosynthesis ABC-type transport system permease subunit
MFMSRMLAQRLEGGAAFEGFAAVDGFSDPTVFEGAGALSLDAVSWNLLQLLGVRPVAGRDLAKNDIDSPIRPILLRDEVWARRFDRSADVFSKAFVAGRTSYRVVGILPSGLLVPASTFNGPSDGVVLDNRSGRTPHFAELGPAVVARLRPGVSMTQAQAEIDDVGTRLSEEFPQAVLIKQPINVNEVRDGVFGLYRSRAWLIVAAVAAVWTVACLNLLTLLLARGRSRERDAAVRSALGASRWQVVRAELVQALLVCGLGTVLAVAACALSFQWLMAIVPATLRAVATSPLDVRLLALAGAGTILAALIAGIVPALRASRIDVTTGLRASPRSTTGRLRGGATLLALEAALGVLLVAGAAVTVRSFLGAAFKNPGYDATNLLQVSVQHGNKRASDGYDPQRVSLALEIVRSAPGVVAASPSSKMPMGVRLASNDAFWQTFGSEGVRFGVGDSFFATLGTPILAGREFSPDEVRDRAPVALLNRRGAGVL